MSSEAELFSVTTTEQGDQGDLVQSSGIGLRTRESIYMPASEFKGYNEALPGAADRLLTIFEEQARHRIAVEKQQIQNEQVQNQNEHEISKITIEADQANRTNAAGFGMLALFGFMGLAVFFAFMRMESAAIVSILVPAVQCIGDWLGRLINHQKTV